MYLSMPLHTYVRKHSFYFYLFIIYYIYIYICDPFSDVLFCINLHTTTELSKPCTPFPFALCSVDYEGWRRANQFCAASEYLHPCVCS